MRLAVYLGLLVSIAGVSCTIWGPAIQRRPDSPSVIEVDPTELSNEENLRRVVRRSADSSSSIGHVVPLPGDTHQLALVHWSGHPSENIFILTRDRQATHTGSSSLWRSTDYGNTFDNETFKFENNTVIEWYYISPDLNKLIFADIIHQVLWVTVDEGLSYTRHSVPFVPDHIIFQGSNSPGSDQAPLSDLVLFYDRSTRALWVSSDLGANWILLANNVTEYRYFWRVLDGSMEDNTTVYYEKAINVTHSQVYMASSPYSQSVLYERLPPITSNTLYISNQYMFVQISNAGSTAEYSSPLWVSYYRGHFQQARFPLQDLAEEHYSVVDTSEGQVFIGVYHDIDNTNLYMSEPEGLQYSLSLEHVISPPESQWTNGRVGFDVHVVQGVIGTYFANVHTPNAMNGMTLVTYDKGGNWLQLTPPFPGDIFCQRPACSLHLHIQLSMYFQSILTKKSAIGVILAQGNLGTTLSDVEGDNGLYSSRDGGFTWTLLDSGSKYFRFAGLGSVVVWVDFRRRASSLDWSCNEGLEPQQVSFLYNSTLETIFVVGMLTERGEKARHVTLFGYSNQWYIIDLNFKSVVTRQCQSSTDFLTWIPSDERLDGRCLLGEHIEYVRRNSSVCCYQDPNMELVVNRTLCPCVMEDFECDFGFERVSLSSPCYPSLGFKWPPVQPGDCPPHTYYNVSSGYRKIAGDKCVPGRDTHLFPTSHPCLVVSDSVQLKAIASFAIPEGNFVPVNSVVSFSVTRTPDSDLVFPDVVQLTWYIIPPTHASCPQRTSVSDILSHSRNITFPCWGDYSVTVQGNISSSSFVLVTHYTAEYKLGSVVVNQTLVPAVMRSGGSLTLQLTAHQVSNELFSGTVLVRVEANDGSLLLSQIAAASEETKVQVQVQLSRDAINQESKRINISLFNNISSTSVMQTVTLAVKGQYAELRLRFNTTDLPESYSSPDMETKLRDEVKSVIQTYLVRSISRASVEIESISLSPENVSSELRKRQQNQQGVLLVDVNILPASLSQHDIESVKNVSASLVSSGELLFVLDGKAVKGRTTSASVLDGKVTTSASVLDGKVTTSASVLDGKVTTSASVLDGKVTTSASVLDGKVTTSASVLDGKVTTSASVLDGKVTTSASVLDSKATTSASVLDGKATTSGRITNRTESVEVVDTVTNSSVYIGLGVGLGSGLLLILTLAVAMGVAVYFYRRKCKRLNVNVRYSSLRHTPDRTPVRFTFSQMKDEDYEGEQDGVEPLVK